VAQTKAKIFNLALGALLLQRQIVDTDTDKSNENQVLNTYWDLAFSSTLEDLDLDSTSSPITLELITADPNEQWDYAYKYPSDCIKLRRIQSDYVVDNRDSAILKRIGMLGNQKAIFTTQESAVAEYLSDNIRVSSLSPSAALAIGYKLAWLAAPLIVGKGAKALRETNQQFYVFFKTEAQEHDRNENFNFREESLDSEFVSSRLS
jgi:hypothetical protein